MATSPVERIAEAYALVTRSDAGARWRFARQITEFRNLHKGKKLAEIDKEIGEKCAVAVGRSKPYSPQWVRAYVNAASKFPAEPKTAREAERFVALCNNAPAPTESGNEAQQEEGSEEATSKESGTKEDALKKLASAVKLARKRGVADDEIIQAVESLLNAVSGEAA